ncbi:MAG: hypothetical protein HY827_09010 [Actinobacteria bacterium]|nr:hypothetical protein [Actinomycetota bacterium]
MHAEDPANDLSPAVRRAVDLDWTAICREIVVAMEQVFARYPTFADRNVHVGRGAGGDNTLAIDEAAEDAVFDVLERVAAEQAVGLDVISEERGEVRLGSGEGVRVVVDPIDGSLNAKRVGMAYSLSVAVATGDTMVDVVYGFVHDFGGGEQWTARAGVGAWLGDRLLDPAETGNDLEVVGIESAKPAFITPELLAAFDGKVARLRAVGSIALTLCQVAAARFDGMLSLRSCRSVDAAAGQLIVREAGGHVIFGDAEAPLAAPLDLAPYKPVIAARDEERARFLAGVIEG